MNTPPDLLPCPSKEARELLAAEWAAEGFSPIAIGRVLERDAGHLPKDEQAALRAIDKALSRHSASTVDVEGLVEALKIIAEGGEPRPVGKPWRADGQASKNDKCIHDRWMYEDCGECVADVARATLSSFPSTLNGEGDNG